MNFKRLFLIRALTVCLLPLVTAVYFHWFPAVRGSVPFMVHGVILACEAAFLFKWILFAVIGHHLRGEHREKRRTAWLFVPLVLLVLYIVRYFAA